MVSECELSPICSCISKLGSHLVVLFGAVWNPERWGLAWGSPSLGMCLEVLWLGTPSWPPTSICSLCADKVWCLCLVVLMLPLPRFPHPEWLWPSRTIRLSSPNCFWLWCFNLQLTLQAFVYLIKCKGGSPQRTYTPKLSPDLYICGMTCVPIDISWTPTHSMIITND